MSKIIVFNNLTLNGIMQAPGRRDEDPRGGFQHGGWAAPFAGMSSREAGEGIPKFGALLLGRRTNEGLHAYWPKQTDNPMTEMLNNMQKYVASTSPHEPLPWINSTLLKGDVSKAFASLELVSAKATPEGVVVATYQPAELGAGKTSATA